MMTITNYLQELSGYYQRLDDDTATGSDWIKLQKFEAEYLDAYKAGKLNKRQFDAVNSAWHDLMDSYRATVKNKR